MKLQSSITSQTRLQPNILLWGSRFLLAVIGLLLILYPFFDGHFRNSLNELTGLYCLPFSGGIAALILSLAIGGRWQKTGFWLALALTGQAAALQMVNAGAGLHYQHYKSIAEIWSATPSVIWQITLIQTAAVLWGLVSRRAEILGWMKKSLRFWQVPVVLGLFFITTTTVSENVGFYAREWLLAGFFQTINLGNIILLAFSIPVESVGKLRETCRPIFGEGDGQSEAESGGPDRFALSLAVGVIILAALLNVFSYERHPHVPDEVVYLMHADFFAHGSLTLPAPPVPEGFEVLLMQVKGNVWYPSPPPGWPLILSLGVLLGVPWLVNPILAGLNLLLAYVLLRELYPKKIARTSILLMAVSPWYIFLGMSFMTHMFALTCSLLAALGVAWARRTGRSVWAWGGGLALGVISLVRPLEAAAMAGLLGLWAVGLGGKRLKISGTAGLVLGSMIIGGLGLYYNYHLTGNPLEFPINAYTDEHFGPNSNAYGFGPDRGMGWAIDPNPGHGPVDALINTNLNVSTLNTELFGWSIGSFLLIAFFISLAKFRRSDYLMLAVIMVIYWLHFFYYFSGGPDFSARYWFLMVVPLVVLSARGIQVLAAKIREASTGGDVRLYATILALCGLTMTNFILWRGIDKYRNFRGMRADVRRLAAEYNFGPSLVLVEGNQHPDFDSAMIYNPLDLHAEATIYAWDRNPETREKLLTEYADRPIWIIKSPSLTGGRFEVAAGPLTTRDLLEKDEK